LLLAGADAFTVVQHRGVSAPSSSTELNLFGGGGNKEGKKPGMMDQLAMFKKAQEMAQKKQKLDTELAQMDFSGTSENEKVVATFKFVPVTNPMDPNPEYETQSFQFDDEWYADASTDDIATACQEALLNGSQTINKAVTEKYQALQSDLMAAFGGDAGAAPAAPES